MRIEYDKESDALYVRLSNNAVDDTQTINQYLYVDVDKSAKPVGLEILCASRLVADDFLKWQFIQQV